MTKESKYGMWQGKPLEEHTHQELCEIASYLGCQYKMTEAGKAARLIYLFIRPSLKRTFRLLPFNEKWKTQWGLMKGWQIIEEFEKIIAGFSNAYKDESPKE